MGNDGQSAVFGKRKEGHTVIIARGDHVRHFTVRPWVAGLIGSVACAAAAFYLLATTYLVFRDDLIGASVARQAQLQHDYEDRISALRAQVDRITSRQMLDQQLVESKVSELLERQNRLSERHGRMMPLAEGEAALGGDVTQAPQHPELGALLMPQTQRAGASAFAPLSTEAGEKRSAADRADMLFVAINKSLRDIESDQLTRLDALTENAYRSRDGIAAALASAGLEADSGDGDAMGGPLLVPGDDLFDEKVRGLDDALDQLDAIKEKAQELPIANPAPSRPVSSTFGMRSDPLLGTPAMHAGIDFRAPSGLSVAATAAGTVVKAGWNGGYGQMVEIDHGGGFSTRYAHLSRIDVAEGERIQAGQTVGQVGSTGRSTGPHLHYEVRQNGAAVDPLRFLKAGKQISRFM